MAPSTTQGPPPEGLSARAECWCGSGRRYKRCHQQADRDPAQAARAASRAVLLGQSGPRQRPEALSDLREVPAHVPRPDYVETSAWAPSPGGRPNVVATRVGTERDFGPTVKTGDDLTRMRAACRLAASVLAAVGEAVEPGVTTDDLDALAHRLAVEAGAYPSPLLYSGDDPLFPKSICTSVNEVVCHGIPDATVLRDGDLVKVDVSVYLDGMHGDCCATFGVGDVDPESQRLLDTTRDAMHAGIDVVRPGALVRDVGRAIERFIRPTGFSVVRDFVGHGVGESFHTVPTVHHYEERRSRPFRLQPGHTFTIEPMINAGTWRCEMWDDGWTAVTADGARSAQFEHAVLVTDDGVEVLTVP